MEEKNKKHIIVRYIDPLTERQKTKSFTNEREAQIFAAQYNGIIIRKI